MAKLKNPGSYIRGFTVSIEITIYANINLLSLTSNQRQISPCNITA